jgi:tetratricopeptide (TPR) repeat protein
MIGSMANDDQDSISARERRRLGLVHREIVVLLVLVATATLGFVVTRAVAAGNERMRLSDAATWYERGARQLRDGQTAEAVASLRHATSKAPNNTRYLLSLANALAADKHEEAARQVLLSLRDVAPEDVDVNLELARLATRRDDVTLAVRYYQQALNDLWAPAERQRALDVRRELIQFLLVHQQRSRAESEVLILTAELPDDAASQVEAGRLLMAAGDARRALDRFRRAMRADPKNPVARVGARDAADAIRQAAEALQDTDQR